MTGTHDITVDEANTSQLAAWDGQEGAYWAANATRYDDAVAPFHQALLAAAAVAPTDRVLDVGCGTGQVTRDTARVATAGRAVGVDLSSAMLRVARDRADEGGLANVEFVRADAQIHPFDAGGFDLAVSRTGTMFFADQVAAFTNIGRALTAGGRLAMIVWRGIDDNEWLREIAGSLAAGRDLPPPPEGVPGPFALANPGRVREVLSAGGFDEVDLEPVDGTMWFGSDADDALQFILGQMGWMIADLDDAGRATATDALHASLSEHTGTDGARYGAGAWLVTARRR